MAIRRIGRSTLGNRFLVGCRVAGGRLNQSSEDRRDAGVGSVLLRAARRRPAADLAASAASQSGAAGSDSTCPACPSPAGSTCHSRARETLHDGGSAAEDGRRARVVDGAVTRVRSRRHWIRLSGSTDGRLMNLQSAPERATIGAGGSLAAAFTAALAAMDLGGCVTPGHIEQQC